jgi:flagellar export protein FliJ
MPFQFRLKSVMKQREFLLRQAQGALGIAQSAQMKIEAEIERLKRVLQAESEQFEQEQQRGIGAEGYRYFKDRLGSLEQELRVSFKTLEKASAEVDMRKQAMIACDKSVKMLESIETRDKELYRLAMSREEQKKLDYAAVLISHRKTIDEGGKS